MLIKPREELGKVLLEATWNWHLRLLLGGRVCCGSCGVGVPQGTGALLK